MKVCKHILPCGDCDKYNIPCKVKSRDTKVFAIKEEENCNHLWGRTIDKDGKFVYFMCQKCFQKRLYVKEVKYV